MNKNSLSSESSLYLKQHENNPVAWLPYSEKAIEQAKSKNLPIFLSIGYSSCHWCHVMAHESFEDEKIAKILNENFICIKVDKEEFPDIDQYYQLCAQVFGKQGGWPLSAFLLPDMRPFFMGTYFPKTSKQNLPSFEEVLKNMIDGFKNNRKLLEENGEKAANLIKGGMPLPPKIEVEGHFPHPSAVMNALKEIEDSEWGGYGKQPKFPHFSFLEWAIEQMSEGKIEQKAGEFIIKTIDNMCMGGINDHCKGGIHRYAVDQKWLVPHFEKMLYDQAGFIRVLAKTSIIYPSPLILDSLFQTLDYLRTEMQSEEGYFFSAQDADSEGHEGLYFTFSETEFDEYILNTEDETLKARLPELKKWFQITKEGNFENSLNVVSLNPAFKMDYFKDGNWEIIRKARKALMDNRKMRIPPSTDNKGLAGWNFMLISALADVVQYNKIEGIRFLARDILFATFPTIFETFLVNSADTSMLNIKHTTTKNVTISQVEDYVYFTEANLRLYELTGNDVLKQNSYHTAQFILREFYKEGELYSRPIAQNALVSYPNIPVPFYDTSYYSSIACLVNCVNRLSVLFSDQELITKIAPLREKLNQFTLNSPISGGEGLRALTYPLEIYRVIKVPIKFLEDKEWWEIIPHLLSRFVFDYHEEKQFKGWQICTLTACTANGPDLKSLIKTLNPNEEKSQ